MLLYQLLHINYSDFIDCKYNDAAKEYAGTISQTISERACQRWDEQMPHVHPFTDSDR